MNRDVRINFGVVQRVVQIGLEEANTSLLIANSRNRTFVAAGQTKGNRIAVSRGGSAVVKVIAPAVKRSGLNPRVAGWVIQMLSAVV